MKTIRQAAQASPVLADLSPGTPALIHRGLRNLQLINTADEPTQAYLQLLSGNTDADWKDFIDAHFDYLLNDEVSLLDLTSKELTQRLAAQHPATGRSTLAATARLIRGMMTRSFEQPADENPTRPLPQQKTTAATTASAPPEPAAASKKSTPRRRSPASRRTTSPVATTVQPPLPTTIVNTVEPVSTKAVSTEPPAADQPAAAPAVTSTRRRKRAATETAAAESATLDVPLSGSITLPLGGNNAATLSWSLSTLDAKSISVVESQLEIARRFLEAVKANAN